MSAKGETVLPKAKTQYEDGLRVQELTQKKQLSSEAQLISNILKNCISKVEIVAALPAILRLNNVPGVVDEQLSRALQEHQILEEKLAALEGHKQESDWDQEGEVGEARKRARALLEKDIKNSTRDLVRIIQTNPDTILGLRAELGVEVGESEHMLIMLLKKFDGHMIKKLLTNVDEEPQLDLYKQMSSSPDHDLELEVSLEEDMKEVDAEISQKSHKLKKLQDSLQREITQEAGMALFVDKQCLSHTNTSKVKQNSIQQEIDQVNIQLNNLILENGQAERVLQEKNKKVKTETEYLLQTFDDKIEEIQANLELHKADCERQEEEQRKLEKLLSVLEVECNQIQERRRLAEEKRMEEMRELELKTKAAIFAQAWWRGYSTRKALKNKGKSKKGKKGKGKKTK